MCQSSDSSASYPASSCLIHRVCCVFRCIFGLTADAEAARAEEQARIAALAEVARAAREREDDEAAAAAAAEHAAENGVAAAGMDEDSDSEEDGDYGGAAAAAGDDDLSLSEDEGVQPW